MNSMYICLFALFAAGFSLPNSNFLRHHENIITCNNVTKARSAKITDYPFVVSISSPSSVNYSLVVESGAILNHHWIVTSPRHLINPDVYNVSVRIGSSNVGYGGQLLDVSKIFVHERFFLSNFQYSVALLKTKQKIRFNRQVRPVRLAKSAPNARTNYDVVGFACNTHNISFNPFSNSLRVATVHVLPVYRNQSSNNTYSYFYAQASGIRPVGAPLVYKNTLFGYYLGDSWIKSVYNQSEVYGNVAALRSWILHKIWENSERDEMELIYNN